MLELGGGPPDQSQEATWRFVQNHSSAALAFLVWDILITLDDEVAFIWTKPRFSLVKWLFLFTRYFAVAVAISMQLIMRQIGAMYPHAEHLCKPWFAFQAASVQLVSCAVDGILMIRIHALYNCSKRIASFLGLLLAAQVLTMIVCVIITVRQLNFDALCLPTNAPRSYLPLAIEIMVMQVIILGLAIYRHLTIARPARLKSALVTLIFRDGLLLFLTVFGLFLFLTITILVNNDADLIVHFWFMSIISCVGCKVIINMQHLAARKGDGTLDGATPAQFTTDIVSLSTDPDAYCMYSMTTVHTPAAWPLST